MTTTCYNLDHTFYFKTKEVSSSFLWETYPWILSLVEQNGEFLVTINPETCPENMKRDFCCPIFPSVPVKDMENATDTILLNMMRLKHPEHEQQINQLMTKSVFLRGKTFEFTSTMLVVESNNNITSEIKTLADQIAILQSKNVELAAEKINTAECKQFERKCESLEQTIAELKGHASKVAAKQKQLQKEWQKQQTQIELERQRIGRERNQYQLKTNQMKVDAAMQVSKLRTRHAANQERLQCQLTQLRTEKEQLQLEINTMEVKTRSMDRRMDQMEADTAQQKKVYKSVKKMGGALNNMNDLRKAWELYQTIPANTNQSQIEKALAFYHDHHEFLHTMEKKKKDLTMETERLKTNNQRERKIYKQLQQMFSQEELEDENAAMERLKNAWEWFKDKENAFDGLRKQLKLALQDQMTEAELTCCILQHVFEPLISKFKSKTWNPKFHVDFINDKQMNEKQLDGYIRAITRRWLAPPTKIKADRSDEEKTKDYSHACAYRASFYHALDSWTNRVNFKLETYISLLGPAVPVVTDNNVTVTVVNRTGNTTDCVENPLIVQIPRNMRAWQFNWIVQPMMNANEQFDGFIMDEEDTLVNANDTMDQHPTVYMVW
tara:strand:+ start:5178 stop:7004 length:1827 start_codon:yes stop_codon:yes gene_type:complete